MSYIDSENCSEHLMTIGMGIDRAPFEFQKWVFFGTPQWPLLSFLRKSSYFGSVFNISQLCQLAFEGLPTNVSLLSESFWRARFQRAFVDLSQSFQRDFRELSESFRRAFGGLSESFRRAFVEPAFVEPAFVEFSESFRRALRELSQSFWRAHFWRAFVQPVHNQSTYLNIKKGV